MISENFNSPHVREHYSSAQKQAIAFLFTTGAKALVIAEQKSSNAEDAFIGANEEAELKQEIVNEERVKSVKRKLSENNAINVYKLSECGRLRLVRLKVKHDAKNRILFSWKSHHKLKKTFLFNSLESVEPLTSHDSGPAMEAVCSYYSTGKFPTSYNHQAGAFDQLILPFLRFRNGDRTLDLRFLTMHEMEACLEQVQIYPPSVWKSSEIASNTS